MPASVPQAAIVFFTSNQGDIRIMLTIKNTINCPGCAGILRISAHVVNDGKDYRYYLCPRCSDIACQDGADGPWLLRGIPLPEIPEVVRILQTLASNTWSVRSTSRSPLSEGKLPTLNAEKERQGVRTRVDKGLPGLDEEKVRPVVRTRVDKGLPGLDEEKVRPVVRSKVSKASAEIDEEKERPGVRTTVFKP